MSRDKGTFNFSANFEVLAKAPLDAKMLVKNYVDLIDPSTWKDLDGNVWLFTGAIVSVANDPSSGVYFLKDEYNYEQFSNWVRIGSNEDVSIGVVNIGDGSANVFAGYDSSGNIQLRTIKGSGGAVVTQTSGEIIIGIDASFAGEVNYGQNVGTGDVSLYYEKSGDALRFRTLKGSDSISLSYPDAETILIDVSGGILDSSVYTSKVIYDPGLDPSLAMPNDVGGIPAGTKVFDLQGDTVKQILNDLLFPTVNPTFVAPSNSFSDNVATLQEVNALLNISYTASFSQGQILVSGVPQNTRSGLPHSYFYNDPSGGTLIPDVSTSALSQTPSITNYVVKIGNQNWTNQVAYLVGPQPLDNKGNPSGTPLPAGTTANQTVTIEGVYPLFATTVSIGVLTQQTLVSMLTGNNVAFTLVPETLGNKQKFEIPNKWTGAPTSRPLVGVQQFNTFSSVWEYPGGSAAASLLLWTTSANSHVIQGISENYTQYTYNGTDRSTVQVRLVF